MPDFPAGSFFFPSPIGVISTWGWEAGSYGGWPAGYDVPTNSAPVASVCCYIPFTTQEILTAYKLWCYNGTTVSGNFDLGIYDEAGNRLTSTGSTAQAGISSIQSVTLGSSLILQPGNYYMGFVADNATARFFGITSSVLAQEPLGVKQQAATFPLPSTATFAVPAQTFFPQMGISIVSAF